VIVSYFALKSPTAVEMISGPELVLIVVLRGVCPSLVGDASGRVGDSGSLLSELEDGALGLGAWRSSRRLCSRRG
jgi:hypothetical protein